MMWWLMLVFWVILLAGVARLAHSAGRQAGWRAGRKSRLDDAPAAAAWEASRDEAWHAGYQAGIEQEAWRAGQTARIEADSVPAWLTREVMSGERVLERADPGVAGRESGERGVELAAAGGAAGPGERPRIFEQLLAGWPGPVLPRFVPRPAGEAPRAPLPRRGGKGRPTPRQRDQVAARLAARRAGRPA